MFWEQISLGGLEKAPEVRIAEVIRVSFNSRRMEIRYLDAADNPTADAEMYYSPAYTGACVTSAMFFRPGEMVSVVVAGTPYVVHTLVKAAGKLFYDMDLIANITDLKGAIKVEEDRVPAVGEKLLYILLYVAEDGGGGTFYKFQAMDYPAFIDGRSVYTYTDVLGIEPGLAQNDHSYKTFNLLGNVIQPNYDGAFPLTVWPCQGYLKLQNWHVLARNNPPYEVWSLPRRAHIDIFQYGKGIAFNTDDIREVLFTRGKMTYLSSTPASDGTGDVYITVGPARVTPDAVSGVVTDAALSKRYQEFFQDVLYIARPYFSGNSTKFNAIPPILYSEPSSTSITFGFIECMQDGALDYNTYFKTTGSVSVTWRDRATEAPRLLDGVYSAEYDQDEFSPTYSLKITDSGDATNIRTITDDRRVTPSNPSGGQQQLVVLDDGTNQLTKRPDFLHVQTGNTDASPSHVDSQINWDFYINDTFMFTMKSRYVGTLAVFNHSGELWYIHHIDLINKLIYAEVHYYEKTETGVGSFCTIKGVVVDAEGQNVIWEAEKPSVSTGVSYNIRPWINDPSFPAIVVGVPGVAYRDELYFRFPYNAVSSGSLIYSHSTFGHYYPSVSTEDAYSMMLMCGGYSYEGALTTYDYYPRCGFQIGRNGGWAGFVKDAVSNSYAHTDSYSSSNPDTDSAIYSYIVKPRSGASIQKGSDFAATATDPTIVNMLTPPIKRLAV